MLLPARPPPALPFPPEPTDNYYLLPFCKPKPADKTRHKWGGLGEVLQGNELIDSQLELKFRTDMPKRDICTMNLDDDKVRKRLRVLGAGRRRVMGSGWRVLPASRCSVAPGPGNACAASCGIALYCWRCPPVRLVWRLRCCCLLPAGM